MYQAAVFYAQVKYLDSAFDDKTDVKEDSEEYLMNTRSKQWLMLEISFYYMTVILTIVFLLLQHFFKLEIQTPLEELPQNDPQIPDNAASVENAINRDNEALDKT